jgi:hypothetical protein
MSIKLSRYPICRHVLTNGRRCKSPALAISAFCFHHQKLRRTRPSTIGPAPALIQFDANPLRDAQSIQHTLWLVLQGVASGHLATGHAGKMLSVLQRASADTRRRAESVF